MQSVESLRDIIQELQEENAALRLLAEQSELLFNGVQSLLALDGNTDPFEAAFASLNQVFYFDSAVAILETQGRLEAIAASDNGFANTFWERSRLVEKALAGRATATTGAGANPLRVDGNPALTENRSALLLPVQMNENRGAIALFRNAGKQGFSRNDVSLAQRYALLASAALGARSKKLKEHENARLQDLTTQLQYRAFHDALTGLGNREMIEKQANERLSARASKTLIALVFLDIDRFKRINDFYGHAVGDKILMEFAERLKKVAGESDCLARISGDEFVVLIGPVDNRAVLERIVLNMQRTLSGVYQIDKLSVDVTASIGVSVSPAHGATYGDLRRNADFAMYRSKTGRKGNAVLYSKDMDHDMTGPLEMERQLREAIDRDAFICAFQPKISLVDGSVTGFEALARWQDTDGVLRQPSDFIPAATELGLLNDITQSLTRKAISALEVLDTRFGKETTMSINIAAVQANDTEFMSELVAQIVGLGSSRRIIMELTEDAVVQAPLFKAMVQPVLSKAGITLSIDDFGTGYSSLSVLANIDAVELKIDRAFISHIHINPVNQRILKAVDQLASAVGMQTIAEGVETIDELNYLSQRTSVCAAQGYYYSRPKLLNELLEWTYGRQTGAIAKKA